jgi:predicted PurR-regulated permease PerM
MRAMSDAGSVSARSLREPLVVLAAIVIVALGIGLARDTVALIAFAALAAIVCRRIQLWFEARGLRGWLALIVTVTLLCLVLVALVLAGVASAGAVAVQLSNETEEIRNWLDKLEAALASLTGVPESELPSIDPSAMVTFARSVASALVPVLTMLGMAVLIVIYLLLDAARLRGRMIEATSRRTVARYDVLATELVTYVRVRAVLGGAAAIADTILLLVLGVPYALLWGFLSFLFSFVPNIGFLLALVPPTVFAFLELGLGPAILVVVGYVVINLAFDYVLQPRVMSTSLDLSPVVVITTIVVWTALIGPIGALLAVPLTIALRAVLAPFPGVRWFLALLGPLPAEPADDDAPPGSAGTATSPPPEPAAEPTISG